MKVKAYVTVEKEVEVNIGIDEIKGALSELSEGANTYQAGSLINTCATVLQSVTDEVIAKFTEAQRDTVRQFLINQSSRYEASK